MTRRGTLRVYLGAAPGVGKTYAMLDEGQRRAERGTDVVVGLRRDARPAAHRRTARRPRRRSRAGRSPTAAPSSRRWTSTRSWRAHPQVALVDELAHTNVPGPAQHAKRWQDVEALLEAGIDVISTVNIQHLESLNDVVQAITGVPAARDRARLGGARRRAGRTRRHDARRRCAGGWRTATSTSRTRSTPRCGNYFRPGNLTALRELALLWLADSVEEGMQRYREQHGITATWETRERVVVALTGGPEGEALIRRAARIAARATGGDLLAVHVARSDGLAGSSVAALAQQRLLVESLGGSYHSVVGDDVAAAILDFARARRRHPDRLGASRRSPVVAALTGPGHRR